MAIRRRYKPRVPQISFVTNENISASEIRLVGDGVETGVYATSAALEMARTAELDLVVISEKTDPPICKILDYKKFLFEQKKKQKKIRANTKKVIVKEIRFGPNTDDHDFNFKLKHSIKFLEDGAKLKAFVFFKGRSIIYKEKGEILLLRLAQELEKYGVVEQMPALEGKRMIMMVVPKRK